MLPAIIPDRFYHAVRGKETVIIHIDYRSKVPANIGQLVKLLKAVRMPEFAPQGLHHPHAHDVFQIAVTVVITALIGEIMFPALFRAIGNQAFNAHQRPCAGT